VHRSVVRALEAPDGTVWAGTNWQRHRRPRSGICTVKAGYRPDPREAGALADGSVTCLASTSDGSMWAATLDGTLHRRRPGAAGFERLTAQNGLPGGPIRAMREDRGGGTLENRVGERPRAAFDTRTGGDSRVPSRSGRSCTRGEQHDRVGRDSCPTGSCGPDPTPGS
jgi:hypothetical protein